MSYHHGNLRHALLEQARTTLESTGVDGLSLRACARAIGVDNAAAYRHFKNKKAVLTAVAGAGFVELGREMTRAMEAASGQRQDAPAIFVAVGQAYVTFGVAHKHLYRLMFGGHVSPERDAKTNSDGETPFALLSHSLDRLVASGDLTPTARQGAETVAWAAVHGLVSLALDGHIETDSSILESATHRLCDVVLAGLRGTESP